jgi:metal-responsive CopG/Arc/MetJ family transcriptional regulator
MKRTTISLPDELAVALDRAAQRQHASVSEVARVALAQHLGLNGDQPRELPFAALGRSGHHTIARDMEKLLQQEWNDLPGRS